MRLEIKTLKRKPVAFCVDRLNKKFGKMSPMRSLRSGCDEKLSNTENDEDSRICVFHNFLLKVRHKVNFLPF